MKTKIFMLLFAVMASVEMMHAAVENGTCGTNLTWSLNTKDSTLTITGSGAMATWSTSSNVPWAEYVQYIAYVSLPNGLTSIGANAFCYCSCVRSAVIPDSVISIGSYAFRDCSGLTNVTIGDGVKSIGEGAFDSSGLTSVTIGNNVTSIGERAFRNCSKLKDVKISNNVTIIRKSTFNLCSALTSIIIPNGVTSIEEYAFYSSALTSVTIPNSVTSVGLSAFSTCTHLTNVTIGNGVTNIGNLAFDYCTRLTDVTIGNNIASIGYKAFSRCSNITKLTIYATTPPSGGATSGINEANCTLYVPAEATEIYANSVWWEDFMRIRSIGSSFTIQFIDWDGTILSEQTINEGESAVPPTNPSRDGYTFIGWDTDFTNVTEELIITAQYSINQYRIEFHDMDGTILKVDSVNYGSSTTAPANPYRQGYTFTGWDVDFSNITSDLIVTAQYELGEEKNFTIIFAKDNNDSEILRQTTILRIPVAPEIVGFTFIGWRPVATIIEDNTIEIEAVYEADEPSSTSQVVVNPINPAQKLIRNGNVYILTGDRTYTLTGQEIK